MTFLLFLITLIGFQAAISIPILSNDDTKLNSIVISEISLPTEASLVVVDQEIIVEPVASFVDLVEKYEGIYGKETENEFSLQKRSSTDDDDVGSNDPDAGGKSIIDKIEIPDPEVKKEFENELQQNQIMKDDDDDDDETTENTNFGTEYDPNHERKIIVLPQADENVANVHNESASLNVHDKENLQVQLVEQLVNQNKNYHEFTTVVPEESFTNHALIKNPEVIEVLEHIVYESNTELKSHELTTSVPIPVLNMDIDPIEIIPKDRHREAKGDNSTDLNDKFAGFVGIPTEDLIQAGEETTESDNFFKKVEASDEDDVDPVETMRETLEYVAIYGRSLNIDDLVITTEMLQTTNEPVTVTEAPLVTHTTPLLVTVEPFYPTKKEIVEINVKVTVNNQKGNETEFKKSSSSEESQQSLPSKSSEENESKEDEKKKNKNVKISSTSSEEIDAENVGEEDLSDEKMDLRSLKFPVTQRPNALPAEIFKDSTVHEIKKKDHPDGIALTYEFKGRQLSDENPEIEDGAITMTTVIETFEEAVTTISEGINLSKELRRHVESFRGDSEENKIILDTDNEAISSKNFKNPLVGVNDLEMMKLKERSFEEEPKLSIAIIPLVAVVSVGILLTLYKFVKGQASSVRLY